MLLSIVLFALTGLSAQNSEDLGFARVLAAEKHKPGAYTTFKEHIQGNQNEIQTVFSALFLCTKKCFHHKTPTDVPFIRRVRSMASWL